MNTNTINTTNTATVITYGEAAEQFYEWYDAKNGNAAAKGVIVLVHGGFWRERYGLEQMPPLAHYWLNAGWAVANIEYRRSGNTGGQWPIIIEDVNVALQTVAAQAKEQGVTGPCVGIGHSAGGQLVLLAAEQLDVTIALAPITDVLRTEAEGLGENAVQEFFGEVTAEIDTAASPIHCLSAQAKGVVIHGNVDERVPVEHSRDFIKAMKPSQLIDYWEIAGLDHFKIIEPSCEIWPMVQAYLQPFQQ